MASVPGLHSAPFIPAFVVLARIQLAIFRGSIRRLTSVRSWVKQASIDDGAKPGVTTAEAERIKALEQEVRELRRPNEILWRFSPRRSSTAYRSDRGVHRREPRRAGCR